MSCADTSISANTITCSTFQGLTGYVTGQTFFVQVANTTTGATTININSLGAKNVTKNGTTAIASGDLVANGNYAMRYDGTEFVVLGNISAGTLPSGPTSPNSVPQFLTSTPSGGVAGSPVYALSGVTPRHVSGTTSTDTIASTDSNNTIVYDGSVAVAVTLPTPTTLGISQFASHLVNNTTGTATIVTITATTNTFATTGNNTLQILQGQSCTITVQSSSVWDDECHDLPFTAGANITITPGPFGQTISATGGGGGLSGMTAGQIPVAATATTVTSSKALAGTDADIATAAGALTNGAIACGDANGGVTTTGCTGGSNFGGTNTQTTSYTLASSDAGKLVVMNCAAACVLTAPATQPSTTFSAYVMSTNSNATFALGGTDTYNGTTTVPLLLPFTILKISADSASATNYVGAYNGLSFDGAHTATITPASGTSAIITAPSGDSLTVKTQGPNSGLTLEANGGDAVVGSLSSTKHASLISGLEHSNITVTFSATPAFNAGQDEVFEMTLTGNVTSSTITNLGAGEFVTFSICQDATGGHTFAFPTSPTFRGAGTISSGAGTCSTQRFWYDGTDLKATAAMVTGE